MDIRFKEVMEIKINNLMKFYTITLLSAGPAHGYDLIKELEQKMAKKISASHVYPFLESLKKNKLVRVIKTGKRDKKTYELTSEGKEFVRQMFSKFGYLIDSAMQSNVKTCYCGCKIYSGGYLEKINGKSMSFCCIHCAASYKSKN